MSCALQKQSVALMKKSVRPHEKIRLRPPKKISIVIFLFKELSHREKEKYLRRKDAIFMIRRVKLII